MPSWLLHFLGLDSASGTAYLAWSGAVSDLGEIALIGAVLGAYRKHNCHQEHCWRIGRHVVDGTPWCNRHHQAARKEGTAE
jgi:hypothetical protein